MPFVGIGVGVGRQRFSGGFDADYQAVLDYATTQGYTLPSSGQQALQNQLVVDLKSAGIWSKLDLCYLFAVDGDSNFATINFKDSLNFQLLQVNSPTFTTNIGFEGDGVSAKLTTNNGGNEYNLLNDAINVSLNNVTTLGYFNNLGDAGKYLFGSIELSPSVEGHHLGQAAATRILSNSSSTVSLSNSFVGIRRNNNSNADIINGSTITNYSLSSSAIPNQTFGILGRDGSGTAFTNGTVSFLIHGAALTNTEIASAQNIIETYLLNI